MLKVKNLRLLLITILMVTLICMSGSVFATNGLPTIGNVNTNTGSTNGIPSIGNINNGTNNTQIVAPALNTSNSNSNNTNNSNRNNSNSSVYDSNLPKTGVDYSVLFIIGIFAIVAIYAYMKIRKYNNVKY